MAIVSQCSKCARTFSAQVATCQICGGACVPVTPENALRLAGSPEPEPPVIPDPVCPCCDGARGGNFITQETRHLKEVSLLTNKRTYLVTSVKVPGVCDACSGSLRNKRLIADVLALLPLPLLFGLTVVMDSKVMMIAVVVYLIYLARSLTYCWADFLLYGRALSWKLVDYVPKEDTSQPSYPSGLAHGAIRLGFYPALVALFAVLVNSGVIKKPRRLSASSDAPPTATATTPTAAANAEPKDRTTQLKNALYYFNLEPTRFISVEIDDETETHPELGRPKVGLDVIDGRKVRVVRAFYSPAEVPAMVDFEIMSAPTLLANFLTTDAEYLFVEGFRLRRNEAEELAAKVTVPNAPPSAIKRRREQVIPPRE